MSTPRTAAVTDGSAQQWTKAGPVAGPLAVPDLQRLQETQEVTVAEPAALGLSGLGLLGEPKVIGHIGGYFLLLSALLAFYAASAEVLNATYCRNVLPLFGRA